MSVPKIAFSFWEGDQFTYMHYLTIFTFSKHNPDFAIKIYTSTNITSNLIKWDTGEHTKTLDNKYDFNQLSTIPNLEIIYINVEKEVDYHSPLSSVWKSDIIRLLKLYEHGGIYIDFDTLFINKIDETLLTLEYDLACNTYEDVINNAFLIAKPKSPVIKVVVDAIITKLHSNNVTNEYQQFGPSLITKLVLQTSLKSNVYFIPNDMTCPYLWYEMYKLFYSNTVQYTNKTFCLHWYNGSSVSREYCSTFSISSINEPKNIFESLLSQSIMAK